MMNLNQYKKAIIFQIILLIIILPAISVKGFSQDDPVLVPDVVAAVPVIDGTMDDSCWQNIPWQSIDNVWIPYAGNVTPTDYTGHYKIAWSSKTNLLYFLVSRLSGLYVSR